MEDRKIGRYTYGLDVVTEYRKQNKRILEFGNVFSYRFDIDHDVLDKYEMVHGVINQDVISCAPTSLMTLS